MIGCTTSNQDRLADANVAIDASKQLEESMKLANDRVKQAALLPWPPADCKVLVKSNIKRTDSNEVAIEKQDIALSKANDRITRCYNHAVKLKVERDKLFGK